MRYIDKFPDAPIGFVNWLNTQIENVGRPTWADLQNPQKNELRNKLYTEQKGLCCYCEQSVSMSGDCHIEHFRPRSLGNIDPLDYSNLLLSCGPNTQRRAPRHCGQKKDNFDGGSLISPMQRDCGDNFVFSGDGSISVNQNSATPDIAELTIDILGLNIPHIKALRSAVIDVFLSTELSENEATAFLEAYLTQNSNGTLNEFHSTIMQVFTG